MIKSKLQFKTPRVLAAERATSHQSSPKLRLRAGGVPSFRVTLGEVLRFEFQLIIVG